MSNECQDCEYLEGEIEKLNSKIEDLENEIWYLKYDLETTQDKLSDKEEENAQLQSDIEIHLDDNKNLENEFNWLVEEIDNLNNLFDIPYKFMEVLKILKEDYPEVLADLVLRNSDISDKDLEDFKNRFVAVLTAAGY